MENSLPENLIRSQRRQSVVRTSQQSIFSELLKKPNKNQSDIEILKSVCNDYGFFQQVQRDVTREKYLKILKNITYQQANKFHTLFELNEFGYHFYLILRGSVFVLVPKVGLPNEKDLSNYLTYTEYSDNSEFVKKYTHLKVVNILTKGQTFGEQALLSEKVRRTATIVCAESCEFGVLDQATYLQVVAPIEERQFYNDRQFFKNLYFFKGWGAHQLNILSKHKKQAMCRCMNNVYSFGDPVKNIYFVEEGEFQIKSREIVVKQEGEQFESDNAYDIVQEQLNSSIIPLNRKWKNQNQLKGYQIKNLAILGPGSSFGFDEVLDNSTVRNTQVTQISKNSVVYYIEKKQYFDLLNNQEILKGIQQERQKLKKYEGNKMPIPSLDDIFPYNNKIIMELGRKNDSKEKNVVSSPKKPKNSQIQNPEEKSYSQKQKVLNPKIQQLPQVEEYIQQTYRETKEIKKEKLAQIIQKKEKKQKAIQQQKLMEQMQNKKEETQSDSDENDSIESTKQRQKKQREIYKKKINIIQKKQKRKRDKEEKEQIFQQSLRKIQLDNQSVNTLTIQKNTVENNNNNSFISSQNSPTYQQQQSSLNDIQYGSPPMNYVDRLKKGDNFSSYSNLTPKHNPILKIQNQHKMSESQGSIHYFKPTQSVKKRKSSSNLDKGPSTFKKQIQILENRSKNSLDDDDDDLFGENIDRKASILIQNSKFNGVLGSQSPNSSSPHKIVINQPEEDTKQKKYSNSSQNKMQISLKNVGQAVMGMNMLKSFASPNKIYNSDLNSNLKRISMRQNIISLKHSEKLMLKSKQINQTRKRSVFQHRPSQVAVEYKEGEEDNYDSPRTVQTTNKEKEKKKTCRKQFI